MAVPIGKPFIPGVARKGTTTAVAMHPAIPFGLMHFIRFGSDPWRLHFIQWPMPKSCEVHGSAALKMLDSAGLDVDDWSADLPVLRNKP